jgi:two-component system sensor histidine kinase/response regulator
MIAEKNRTTNIMVVDDTVANLKLLEGILGRRGYRVRSFPRGRLALAAAALEPPDLILLDINIPEMNGYEMCAKLKANPALAAIPVIFISALNEMLDKVKAFGCGGVDYISKPFQIEEILTRVENHVNMRRLQVQADQYNARVDESVRLQTRQLVQTNERLLILHETKNDFLRLLSQALRTPPNALVAALGKPATYSRTNVGHAEMNDAGPPSPGQLSRLLEDALLLTQIPADRWPVTATCVTLSPLLHQAMDQTAGHARLHEVILPPVPGDLPPVSGHAGLIQRAFLAVLEMAVKFAGPGQTLELSGHEHAEEVWVVLTSRGQSVPEAALSQIFLTAAPGGEADASLAMAQRILSLFGGGITVENQTPAGIKWTTRFKSVPPAETGRKPCA